MVVAAACDRLPTDSGDPLGAVPWTPSRWFERWWATDQRCSGLAGDMSRIRWFVVPGRTFRDPSGAGRGADGELVGLAKQDGRIFLADGSRNHPRVVRHEMLHQLLYQNGRGRGHPSLFFDVRCPLMEDSYVYDQTEDFYRDSVRRARGREPVILDNPYYPNLVATPRAADARLVLWHRNHRRSADRLPSPAQPPSRDLSLLGDASGAPRRRALP